MIRIRSSRDFATGLLFVVIGAAAWWIGRDYAMGVAQRPGTGVLPRILAYCLIVSGLALWIKSVIADGPPIGEWAWRPLAMITIATIAFALLIEPIGLVATMIVSLTLAAAGTHETRWREFAVFLLVMLAIGFGVFIYGLGMPIKVFPWS